MKSSIAHLCPSFNMQRVVQEYAVNFYFEAHEHFQRLLADGASRARALAAWDARLRAAWSQIRIQSVEKVPTPELAVGSRIRVRAWIRLGPISTSEVAVELYLGHLDSAGEIANGVPLPMEPAGQTPEGLQIFEASGVSCLESGLHGYTVRVLPFNADEARSFLPGLIAWA
jgi:starch phosphorylase